MEGTLVENTKQTADAIPSVPKSPWESSSGTSPWGKSPVVTPCSLSDVMSEELAKELEQDEMSLVKQKAVERAKDVDLSSFLLPDDPSTDSDLLLAQVLQLEYDMEHDTILSKEEQKFNGQSKVSVNFDNYRSVHPALIESDSSDDDGDYVDYRDKDSPTLAFKKQGYNGKGKNITTKHDPQICGRRNADRMENFPPEFDTGDGRGMDMKLSNRVYNKLKAHSMSEGKRSQRLHEKKEHSTAEHAVDPRTRLLMYKLINGGTLEAINGIVSAGKEAVVFHANGGHIEGRDFPVPTECAVKVFKTTLNEFKNRSEYIKGDFRFFKDEFKKQNPRKIIKIWAEKEMINLNRMRRYGIPCPEVVVLKKHILVMSFIGQDQRPAPKLKDAQLSSDTLQKAYTQVIEIMKTLHKGCGLVHADLSEYNMLWHNGQVYFIDVSQAVDFTHPHALQFLLRDCTNVYQFFSRRGVTDVLNQYEMFNMLTGLELQGEGQEFLAQIQEYEKSEEWLSNEMARKDFAFDYFFNKSTKKESKSSLDDMIDKI